MKTARVAPQRTLLRCHRFFSEWGWLIRFAELGCITEWYVRISLVRNYPGKLRDDNSVTEAATKRCAEERLLTWCRPVHILHGILLEP